MCVRERGHFAIFNYFKAKFEQFTAYFSASMFVGTRQTWIPSLLYFRGKLKYKHPSATVVPSPY